MELRRYWEIVVAYRWLLLLTPLTALLIGFGATYAVSPRYTSTAVVQLIPEDVEPRTIALRSQDGSSTVALGLKDPTELLAQGIIENLGSREVAQLIVDEIKLTPPPPPTGWEALKRTVRTFFNDAWTWLRYGYVAQRDEQDALVDAVNGALTARLVRGSYYLTITASWIDPQTATALANASVNALRSHSNRVAAGAAGEHRRFLETQVQQAKERVDKARQQVLAYSSGNSLVAVDSIRAALAALDEGRTAQTANERALADARSRLSAAQEQVRNAEPNQQTVQTAEGSSTGTSTVQTTSPNPAYQELQDRAFELRQEIAALEARSGQVTGEARAEHELNLADARRRLAATEQRLAATNPTLDTVQTVGAPNQNTTTVRTSSPNPVHQALQDRVFALQQEVAALEARQTQLKEQVQAREQELRGLTLRDGQLAALAQELSLASDAYSRRTMQWYDALFEEARPVAPIRLVDAAVAPLYPAYPIKIIWALIGAAAGLALAVIFSFVHYTTDVSLRSATEAEDTLELPLLAVVPPPGNGDARSTVFRLRRGG